MGQKVAKNNKSKVHYVPAGSSGKHSGTKVSHSAKPHKSKTVIISQKTKSPYGWSDSASTELHDDQGGWAIATVSPEAEPETLEQESKLADQLVTQVANEGPDVNRLCDTYGLRREELGRLTGFSLRALAEWASGKLPSQPAQRRLQEVRRLLDALSEVVHRESIPRWLHQPNQGFGRLTPLQVIELGEIDRLWAMVHHLASGQPS